MLYSKTLKHPKGVKLVDTYSVELGKKNNLLVVKQVDFGFYLCGDHLGDILIPNRYAPEGCKVDDFIDVFIYLDSEDRLIATTEEPYAEVGSCAHMEVVSKNSAGAFLDWGLPKDLFVPFKEQRVPMHIGESYSVFVFIDATDRIAGSSKLSRFLEEHDNDETFTEEQEVSLQIVSRSDLGYKAIIDGTHLGLIHNSDLLQPVKIGSTVTGYIKNIREDGRINLTLQAKGKNAVDSLSQTILDFIKSEGGSSTLTDKSSPDIIYKTFKVSKSHYKKALGKLYKEKRITLTKDKVTVVDSSPINIPQSTEIS